jgi:hypothetical protein
MFYIFFFAKTNTCTFTFVTSHFKTDTPTEHFGSHKILSYMHISSILFTSASHPVKKTPTQNGLSGYSHFLKLFLYGAYLVTGMCSKKRAIKKPAQSYLGEIVGLKCSQWYFVTTRSSMRTYVQRNWHGSKVGSSKFYGRVQISLPRTEWKAWPELRVCICIS